VAGDNVAEQEDVEQGNQIPVVQNDVHMEVDRPEFDDVNNQVAFPWSRVLSPPFWFQ